MAAAAAAASSPCVLGVQPTDVDEELEYFGLCAWFRPDSTFLADALNGAQCADQHCQQQVYVPHPVRMSLFLLFRHLLSLERRHELFQVINHTILTDDAVRCSAGSGSGRNDITDFLRAYVDNDMAANGTFMSMRKNIIEVTEQKLSQWIERFYPSHLPRPLYAQRAWLSVEDCEFVATLCAHLQRASPEYQLRPLSASAQDPTLDVSFLPRTLSPNRQEEMAAVVQMTASSTSTSTSTIGKRFAELWLRLGVFHPFDLLATAGQMAALGGQGSHFAARADVEFLLHLLFREIKEHRRIDADMQVLFVPTLLPGQALKVLVRPMEAFTEMHSALRSMDAAVSARISLSVSTTTTSTTSPWCRPLLPGQLIHCVPVLFAHIDFYANLFRRFPYDMHAISDMHDGHKMVATMNRLVEQNKMMEQQTVQNQLLQTTAGSICATSASSPLPTLYENDDEGAGPFHPGLDDDDEGGSPFYPGLDDDDDDDEGGSPFYPGLDDDDDDEPFNNIVTW